MRIRSSLITSLLLAASTVLPVSTALAANYPDRPITMIVPFPPGGPTDLVARVLAKQLADQMGQSVVVENKGGANGTIGMQAAASARPDGYTILYNTSSIALSPNLYSKLSFNPEKDFAVVTSTATVPMVLLVHPSVPASAEMAASVMGCPAWTGASSINKPLCKVPCGGLGPFFESTAGPL